MDLRDKLSTHFNEHVLQQLKEQNIDSLKKYSDSYSYDLNNYLLKGKRSDSFYNHHIGLIRNSIKLSKSPCFMTLYHGTSNVILNYSNPQEYKNKYIDIKSLLSCSIDKDMSKTFMDGYIHCPTPSVLLEIYIPIGYPALWMGDLSVHPNEQEVLLLNNTRLEIITFMEEQLNDNVNYTLIKTIPKRK